MPPPRGGQQLGQQFSTGQRPTRRHDVSAVEVVGEAPLVTLEGQISTTSPVGKGDNLVGDAEPGVEFVPALGEM